MTSERQTDESRIAAIVQDVRSNSSTAALQNIQAAAAYMLKDNSDQLDLFYEDKPCAEVMSNLFAGLEKSTSEQARISFLPSMKLANGDEFQILSIADCNYPFIVETIKMHLAKHAHAVALSMNAIFVVTRNAADEVMAFEPFIGQEAIPENIISVGIFVLQDHLPSEQQQELITDLQASFLDIRNVQQDWHMMTDEAEKLADVIRSNHRLSAGTREQEAEFLDWLVDAHFTFLGMRKTNYASSGKFALDVDWDSSLGILHNAGYQMFAGKKNAQAIARIAKEGLADMQSSIRIFKTAFHSTVRRDSALDAILVKRYNDRGDCIGDVLIVGFFAWAAYAEPLDNVPLVKKKSQMVMLKNHATRRSYRGRQLLHMLESYPRDLLFQVDDQTLLDHIELLRRAHRRNDPQVLHFYNSFSFGQYFSIVMPRANYSAALRMKMSDYLNKHLPVKQLDYGVYLPDSTMWRVDFRLFLHAEEAATSAELIDNIQQMLLELAQSSADKLRASLHAQYSARHASELLKAYAPALDENYWSRNEPRNALYDIQVLEQMSENGTNIQAKLYKTIEGWQVRLYNTSSRRVYLSDVMPMLEHLGLTVHFEEPFLLNMPDDVFYGILVFSVSHDALDAGVSDLTIEHFNAALTALFAKKSEVDNFLKLVLIADLSWRDIVVMRAYAKYLKQIRFPLSVRFIADTLAQYPQITKNLVNLFYSRFAPEQHDKARESALIAQIDQALSSVANLEQDRLLNRYKQLILATLRTNFFQTAEDGGAREATAFKLSPRDVEGIPAPVPLREIFVYSPDFEAVHLRFGFVARGGLRWSDRNEDFRTEVLGLVKAQQVKNAVIVPMGSKGGFVLKNAMPDRESFMKEGVMRYRQFIASMLQIADSYLPGGEIRKPVQVICQDNDDPYLVVAADKGTATFSDFANDESEKADFWLGDAFASGGSKGYDHKKMGITARGGWESVKRHFREMNHNTQTTPFNVVGVGDMSGDVFGNGMLLSEHIRLIGAFNHLHIFVDPSPDPARSYQERKRLFALPRSGWTDYDPKVMSKGAQIYERSAKSLTITPEIKAAFGIEADTLAPNELILHLLTMPSDLLWFGGIGTYIKSRTENNADVGDKANDAIRINGDQVGACVIGEGANLGVTQLGRIDYCKAGGRCNTDAIDNSAGVDCSDHEVNIKILLGSAIGNGRLKAEERDDLLESMTDEVAELVLKNNYAQTLSLSMVEADAPRLLDMHQRVMLNFERLGELNRTLEGMPDDEEIERRRGQALGLYRPELSVLLAYGKNIIYQDLQKSPMMDDPMLQGYLTQYFPSALRERFPEEIANHQLRRQIIATKITNLVINRSGVGFISEMVELTGTSHDRVCLAFMAVSEIFNLPSIWSETESLDTITCTTMQHRILAETTHTIKRVTEWLLLNVPQPMNVKETVAKYGEGLRELQTFIEDILSGEALQLVIDRKARFEDPTVPQALSSQVGQLKVLSSVCDIVDLAAKSGRELRLTAQVYFAVSDRFALDHMRSMANAIHAQDVWTSQALSAAINDLWSLQSEITLRVLNEGKGDDSLSSWLEKQIDKMVTLDRQYTELFQRRQIDVAMLSVLQRHIRMLL